ncbi:MAG: hypothetical protein KDD69_20240, partial [Bdellovibrionales bacterium]|nr:hypothetical protein [Bdellovibrionales bacterium]
MVAKYQPLRSQHGFALVAVMLLISVLLAMLGAYSTLTRVELATSRASGQGVRGFYAAEAGLNVRAEAVRALFTDYNFPTGVSPDSATGPCEGANTGSGDFACQEVALGNHRAVSYVESDPANPYQITVPPGERYQNLSANEFRYSVISRGLNSRDEVEAILELRFKSRLVPMFQFAAFYNKDLEINNGPDMALAGPIHTNGDLYLGPDGSDLAVYGQVTVSGDLYRGRKDQIDSCHGNLYVSYPAPSPINVGTPSGCSIGNCQLNVCSGSNRSTVTQAQINKYNGLIQVGVPELELPEPEEF